METEGSEALEVFYEDIAGDDETVKRIMSETRQFGIFYSDLTEAAQLALCDMFKTTPEEENWDVTPLAIAEREVSGNGTE